MPVLVSIPRSGFCLFILQKPDPHLLVDRSFNPSVGILFVHTILFLGGVYGSGKFQSLGRDSVCSYKNPPDMSLSIQAVSIPRSGFCLFILLAIPLAGLNMCSFNPSVGILFVHTIEAETVLSRPGSFNPSVGILFVHTCFLFLCCWSRFWFQSLGRDSVCSYPG